MSEQTVESGRDPAIHATPLTVREAAAASGMSERTIRRAISRGDLSAIKHPGVLRIAPERSCTVPGEPPLALSDHRHNC